MFKVEKIVFFFISQWESIILGAKKTIIESKFDMRLLKFLFLGG